MLGVLKTVKFRLGPTEPVAGECGVELDMPNDLLRDSLHGAN